jgi:hypothetical protein
MPAQTALKAKIDKARRANVLDALRTVLTPDEELAGQAPQSDREHLRFTAAA